MKRSGWIITAIIIGSIGLLILIISLIWIIKDNSYFRPFSALDSRTASELGGYLAGFVGVFWTGAAAILIYATFRAQQTQNFDTTFFNLIKIYHNLVNSTEGKVLNAEDQKVEILKGRLFFSAVLKKLKECKNTESFPKFISKDRNIPEIDQIHKSWELKKKTSPFDINPELEIMGELQFLVSAKSKEFVASQYEFIYPKYQSQLGHYFRFLYNIFKFVLDERNKRNDAAKYINLIQAQMSNDELGLLFYNAISKYGKSISGEQRFYRWLKDFGFFENIDPNSLIQRDHHVLYGSNFKFLTPDEREKEITLVNTKGIINKFITGVSILIPKSPRNS